VPAKRARLEPASDEDEEGDDAIDDDEDDEDAGDDDAGDDEEGEEIDEDDEEEEGEEEEEGDEEEEEEEGDDIEEDDEEDEDTRPTSAPAKKAAAPMAKPAKPAADEDEQGKDSKVTFESLGLTKALCDGACVTPRGGGLEDLRANCAVPTFVSVCSIACAAMKWTAPTQIQRDAIPVALQGACSARHSGHCLLPIPTGSLPKVVWEPWPPRPRHYRSRQDWLRQDGRVRPAHPGGAPEEPAAALCAGAGADAVRRRCTAAGPGGGVHAANGANGPLPLACPDVSGERSELAFQIAENFEGLGANIGVRTAVIVGGVDNMTQAIALSKRPHIVIGTPGRIVDHLENTKGFHLRTLKFLVRPSCMSPPSVPRSPADSATGG